METELISGETLELDNPSVGIEYRVETATADTPPVNNTGTTQTIAETPAPQPQPQAAPAIEAVQGQWQQERQMLASELQRQRAEAAEMREVLWQVKLANTPEGPQRDALVASRQNAERQAERQILQSERAEFFRSVEPIMKEVVLNGMLDKYRNVGVTKEELASFSTPEDAERYATNVARRFRAQQAQKAAPANQAASTQGQPAPKSWRTQTLGEQLSAAIAQMR